VNITNVAPGAMLIGATCFLHLPALRNGPFQGPPVLPQPRCVPSHPYIAYRFPHSANFRPEDGVTDSSETMVYISTKLHGVRSLQRATYKVEVTRINGIRVCGSFCASNFLRRPRNCLVRAIAHLRRVYRNDDYKLSLC
jgi:hypothetical protein